MAEILNYIPQPIKLAGRALFNVGVAGGSAYAGYSATELAIATHQGIQGYRSTNYGDILVLDNLGPAISTANEQLTFAPHKQKKSDGQTILSEARQTGKARQELLNIGEQLRGIHQDSLAKEVDSMGKQLPEVASPETNLQSVQLGLGKINLAINEQEIQREVEFKNDPKVNEMKHQRNIDLLLAGTAAGMFGVNLVWMYGTYRKIRGGIEEMADRYHSFKSRNSRAQFPPTE